MYLIQNLLKQLQFIVILLSVIISKIQRSCIYLFLINRPANYEIFHPNMLQLLISFGSEFSSIKVSFTDRNSKPLYIEDEINITQLLIKVQQIKYDALFSSSQESNICKRFFVLSFAKNMSKNIDKNVSENFKR